MHDSSVNHPAARQSTPALLSDRPAYRLRNRLLAAMVVAAALIMGACGSQPAATPKATGTATAGTTPTPTLPPPTTVQITRFPISTGSNQCYVYDFTAGPDGNLWLVGPCDHEKSTSKIGRMTPDGQITTFEVP